MILVIFTVLDLFLKGRLELHLDALNRASVHVLLAHEADRINQDCLVQKLILLDWLFVMHKLGHPHHSIVTASTSRVLQLCCVKSVQSRNQVDAILPKVLLTNLQIALAHLSHQFDDSLSFGSSFEHLNN